MNATTKQERLQRLTKAEADLKAEAARQPKEHLRRAYETAAGAIRVARSLVETTVDEAAVRSTLERVIGQVSLSLGMIVRYHPDAAVQVGTLPMELAVICSET